MRRVPHRAGVEHLAGMGVLDGTECAPGEFCPGGRLERWVMAVWLVRVLDGADPVASGSRFADVDPDAWWAPFVERLAVLGVTAGCATGPDRYCPDDSATRGQMATFLTRAFDLESAPSFGFVDISGSAHAAGINALAGAGVTAGCATGPARYCPDDSVTRGQMATFLTRAIGIGPLSVGIRSDTSRIVKGSFKVAISFSRAVTGFGLGDVEVVNGRASGLVGSGSDYEVTVAPAAEGTVVVRVPRGAGRDAAGSQSEAPALLVRTFRSVSGRGGPGFDVWDRDGVVAAYGAEFGREEPDLGFTGNVADCDAGTTSQAFRDSIVQRVNWYRQMAGIDTVTEDPSRSAAAQRKALIMSAEGKLSHHPPSDWACYTEVSIGGGENLGRGSVGVAWRRQVYAGHWFSNNLSRWASAVDPLPAATWRRSAPATCTPKHFFANQAANALCTSVDDYSGDAKVAYGSSVVSWRGPPPVTYPPKRCGVAGRSSYPTRTSARATVSGHRRPTVPSSVQVIDRDSRYGGAAVVWAVHGDYELRPGVPERFPSPATNATR